jgi:hypothetical protein
MEQKGGLALLWANDIEVHIQSFSHSHIDAWITNNVGQRWRLTSFYGQPDASKRHESWSLFRRLRRMSDLPWLVMGDLNEILADNEKVGRRHRNPQYMQAFRDVIDECKLRDIGFLGPKFTWCNRRHGRERVR